MYEDFITDMRPRLGAIATPTLVLYAYDATMGLPPAAVDGLYQSAYAALPSKKLVRIDGSYHFIQIDQPEAFERELVAFLAAR
jgi:pimeloyl-ACP methyl ester carboxylesterase